MAEWFMDQNETCEVFSRMCDSSLKETCEILTFLVVHILRNIQSERRLGEFNVYKIDRKQENETKTASKLFTSLCKKKKKMDEQLSQTDSKFIREP